MMFPRRALLFAFALTPALVHHAAAQPPPARPGSAVVRGRILAADTSKPLKRARVTFMSVDLGGPPRSTTTNVNGQYEMKDLPAGRYNVTADRSGYLPLRYGQRRPLESARPLQVSEGQTIEKIDFTLPRTGAISGRVVDEIGDVVAGATIFALRTEFWRGRRQLVPAGPATTTDDVGRYRVTGLAPGSYVIRATTRDRWTATRNGSKDSMSFLPTYFSGTTDVATAGRVTVGIGQQIAGIDLQLVPGKTVTVSGRAVDSHGTPLANVSLSQSTIGPNGGIVGPAAGGGAPVAADGTFTIKDVVPGEYTLVAAGHDEVARFPLVVTAAGVDNLSLVGSPGWTMTGVVTTDTGGSPSMPVARVRVVVTMLTALPGMIFQGEPRYTQKLDEDWAITIGGISGPARVRVLVPDGWALKSIMHKGRDIADSVIEPPSAAETMSGVEVVLTNRVTTVNGQLVDRQGMPVDGSVVIFSTDNAKWYDGTRFIRSTRPDQSGQFSIGGLPAGEYYVIALEDVQDGAWNDPEYLESIRRSADRITLAEGATRAIAPKLVIP